MAPPVARDHLDRRSASATCALVTTMPLGSMMTPVPIGPISADSPSSGGSEALVPGSATAVIMTTAGATPSTIVAKLGGAPRWANAGPEPKPSARSSTVVRGTQRDEIMSGLGALILPALRARQCSHSDPDPTSRLSRRRPRWGIGSRVVPFPTHCGRALQPWQQGCAVPDGANVQSITLRGRRRESTIVSGTASAPDAPRTTRKPAGAAALFAPATPPRRTPTATCAS